jgi:hypothetical protein
VLWTAAARAYAPGVAPDLCQNCGVAPVRVHVGDRPLCDRCADRRIARLMGMPELSDPPPPETLQGPDGRRHELQYRFWRAPTGVVVELEEAGVGPEEGYRFSVLGAHDADIAELVDHVRTQALEGIGRLYLEPDPHRSGWLVKDDAVEGRLVWNDDEPSGPYSVVVDGRTLSWDELGCALRPFEGWRIRIVIEDRHDDVRPDADVLALPVPADSIPEEPVNPTIDTALNQFLEAQRARLAPRTYRRYEEVVDLLRHCLNAYGYQYLATEQSERFQQAYSADDEGAFCHLFGPEKIADGLGEFLGYFMIRKVMASEELLRAAGTVTKKLGTWLGEHGYLDAQETAIAVERGAEAARDLPRAEKLSNLLYDAAEKADVDTESLADDDYVDDYLMIERVEPGALWFEGDVGPVPVPKAASDIAQVGWSVNVVLGRMGIGWQLIEVGNVYP